MACRLNNMGRVKYLKGEQTAREPEVQHIDHEIFSRGTAYNLLALMKADVLLFIQQLR